VPRQHFGVQPRVGGRQACALERLARRMNVFVNGLQELVVSDW
jgi:hypothetical protein